MKTENAQAYQESTKEFLAALNQFSREQFNKKPFDDAWTPAQIADHILKSQMVFPKLLAGKTEDTTRDPLEKKEIIKNIFLDFTTKMKSPEFILPQGEPLDQQEIIQKLDEKCSEIIDAMHTHDLNKTCFEFVLPNIGPLTGVEWGWFITYHTQRHKHQLGTTMSEFQKTS